MNRQLRTSLVAATVLAGLVLVSVPQHAVTAFRVLTVAVVAITGALVLAAVGQVVRREPPRTALDRRPVAAVPPLDPRGLRDARRDLAQPAAPGSVPRAVWERLVLATSMRLQQLGVDVATARGRADVATWLRPDTTELVSAPPVAGTRRDPAAVAATVHRTLDELDSLTRSTGGTHGHRR